MQVANSSLNQPWFMLQPTPGPSDRDKCEACALIEPNRAFGSVPGSPQVNFSPAC